MSASLFARGGANRLGGDADLDCSATRFCALAEHLLSFSSPLRAEFGKGLPLRLPPLPPFRGAVSHSAGPSRIEHAPGTACWHQRRTTARTTPGRRDADPASSCPRTTGTGGRGPRGTAGEVRGDEAPGQRVGASRRAAREPLSRDEGRVWALTRQDSRQRPAGMSRYGGLASRALSSPGQALLGRDGVGHSLGTRRRAPTCATERTLTAGGLSPLLPAARADMELRAGSWVKPCR
jgi:hypothetical protein